MSKMAELSAQGVTDLHSYTVGYEDGIAEFRSRLLKHYMEELCLEARVDTYCGHPKCRIISMEIIALDKMPTYEK